MHAPQLAPPARQEILALLQARFGHRRFRPGQEEVLQALLTGRDVLALLPTGAGKSLVFQIASQLLPGLTIVVSPLLALMRDQEESLEELGVEVAAINSTLSEAAAEEELARVERGEARLLYVTPERFLDGDFTRVIGALPISLLAVDEAHCVSEWGHSFRPAYLVLGPAVRRLGRPTVLALTGTATPWVRRDIVEQLGMRDPEVVVRGCDRPNLFLAVRRVESEADEYHALRRLLAPDDDALHEHGPITRDDRETEAFAGPGIIYTATTRGARETAEWLRSWGVEADFYHGQRSKRDRARVQDAFMAGAVRVIAATNAFGLGVDKPDVRFVVHRDIPASLEAYYQEAGRAGRDGEPARCVLLMNYFGETYDPRACTMCDTSVFHPPVRDMAVVPEGAFAVGAHVRHDAWGNGVVGRVTPDGVTVLFDAAGFKTFALDLVRERGLLEPSEAVVGHEVNG